MTARRVMVGGNKGGVGKTTITTNLAAEAAALGRRVLVVELDPQGNATTRVTGLLPDAGHPTIADVLVKASEGADAAELLAEHVVSAERPDLELSDWARQAWRGVDVLPANEAVAGLALDPSHYRSLARILDEGADGWDLVLMDCAPGISLLTTLGAYASDSIISVTTPTADALAGVRQLIRGVVEPVRRWHTTRLVGVVANIVDTRETEQRHNLDELAEGLGDLFCRAWLPDRAVARQAEGARLPIRAMTGEGARTLTDLYSKLYRYLIEEPTS